MAPPHTLLSQTSPKGDYPEKVIEYRVINGVFRGTLKISE